MPPWMGGEMIQDVRMDASTYAEPPSRFEAGTPAIGEAIALGGVCDYSPSSAWTACARSRRAGGILYDKLRAVDGVTVYGPTRTREGRRSPRSTSRTCTRTTCARCWTPRASRRGVGTTARSRCHRYLEVPATARGGAYVYNTEAEVDVLVDALKDTIGFFKEINGA